MVVLVQGVVFSIADPAGGSAQWAMSQYFSELDARFQNGFASEPALDDAASTFKAPIGLFVLALSEETVVACGALQHVDAHCAEIKRMWVSASTRGSGIGKRLLNFLEDRVRESGRTRVILDTNASLIEAISMYRSCGYTAISRYNDNPYADLWFEKYLQPG